MKRKNLISILLICVFAISTLLSGCGPVKGGGGGGGGAKGKVLKVNDQTEPGTLHPGKAETTNKTPNSRDRLSIVSANPRTWLPL